LQISYKYIKNFTAMADIDTFMYQSIHCTFNNVLCCPWQHQYGKHLQTNAPMEASYDAPSRIFTFNIQKSLFLY